MLASELKPGNKFLLDGIEFRCMELIHSGVVDVNNDLVFATQLVPCPKKVYVIQPGEYVVLIQARAEEQPASAGD